MKNLLVTLLLIYGVAGQPASPIWNIVGGQVGLGSLYNIVTEQITFPAYQFHYETQNTIVVNGDTFLIPDECFGYASPQFSNDSRRLIVDTVDYYYNQYVMSWGISAGVNIDGVNLKFAFSHTTGQIDAMLQDKVNSLAQDILSWQEFVLEMWPGEVQLAPRFQSYVNALPQNYDPVVYRKFIEDFGTHIINTCYYGARVNFTALFHSQVLNKMGIQWVQNQISLAVGWMEFNVGINWNDFDNTTHINDTFLENSDNLTLIVGGEPAILTASGFKAWWQTVRMTLLSSILPAPSFLSMKPFKIQLLLPI